MNVRSKVLKIRNLPKDGNRIDYVNAKPYLFIIICLLIGTGLLFTRVYILGILMLGLFLYYLIFVRNMILIEFYETYAVFYLMNGRDECFLLFWEDIEHWDITSSRGEIDVLNIRLLNHETIALKCPMKKKVVQYFKRYAGGVEEVTKQHAL